MKALIDTCILVDALQLREPFFDDAQNILIAQANGEFDGVITANSVLDLYYIIHKYTGSDGKTRKHILSMLRLFDIVDTAGADVRDSVFSDMRDYEDAVMDAAARRAGADLIITRNIRDFRKSKVRAVAPDEFLEILDGEEDDD